MHCEYHQYWCSCALVHVGLYDTIGVSNVTNAMRPSASRVIACTFAKYLVASFRLLMLYEVSSWRRKNLTETAAVQPAVWIHAEVPWTGL